MDVFPAEFVNITKGLKKKLAKFPKQRYDFMSVQKLCRVEKLCRSGRKRMTGRCFHSGLNSGTVGAERVGRTVHWRICGEIGEFQGAVVYTDHVSEGSPV